MRIKTLRLEDFRSYGRQEIEFPGALNILYGENAQGKTNVLEAIFLCSTGRSHRTQKDAEMVRFGEPAAVVEVGFERRNLGDVTVEVTIQRTGRKGIRVNGVPLRRAGDLLGMLNCVIFSPEDLSIIKDEPQVRRRFLDMFISQIKPVYYFNLHRYNQVLRQRNALLRQARENRSMLETIGAWDEPLAELGAQIMRERLQYVEKLGEYTKKNHTLITGGRETVRASYAPSVKATVTAVAESSDTNSSAWDAGGIQSALRDAFLTELGRSLETDVSRMSTQYGPHKDDIVFSLDGKNTRLYGSQGQQRTAALALKMAQVDVMTDETGDVPILLLDDVMSELDRGRRDNLSSHMKGAQTFMTGTVLDDFSRVGSPESANYYLVGGGRVERQV
jgi:DNA replication and repair protein RecF